MIEVILLERIERLGQMGQVVKVRPGYARNFLLPQQKALRATKSNMELFEKQRTELEAANAAERAKAEAVAAKMGELKVTVIRAASEMGQLYGSVAARDVSEAAKAMGHALERTQVQIDAPIKSIGMFPVKVKLHPEVIIKVIVNIARSNEEAATQIEKSAVAAKKAEDLAAVEATVNTANGVANDEGAPEDAKEKSVTKKKIKASKTDVSKDEAQETSDVKGKKPRAKKATAE